MALYTHFSELPLWKDAQTFVAAIERLVDRNKKNEEDDFAAVRKHASLISFHIAKGFRSMNPHVFSSYLESAQKDCLCLIDELKTLYHEGKMRTKDLHSYIRKTLSMHHHIERTMTGLQNLRRTEKGGATAPRLQII